MFKHLMEIMDFDYITFQETIGMRCAIFQNAFVILGLFLYQRWLIYYLYQL